MGVDVHQGWDFVMAFPIHAFYSYFLGAMGLVLSACLSSTTNGEVRMILR